MPVGPNVADAATSAIVAESPPAKPRVQPWTNLCKIVPLSSFKFVVRWAGKDHQLPEHEQYQLDPATLLWTKEVTGMTFESLGAAYDAASASSQPPGW